MKKVCRPKGRQTGNIMAGWRWGRIGPRPDQLVDEDEESDDESEAATARATSSSAGITIAGVDDEADFTTTGSASTTGAV